MIELTLKEVAAACGGSIEGADPEALVRDVVIDSRAASSGSLFVAFRGERVDGRAFIPDAIERGATAAMATAPVDDAPVIVVPDPLEALTALAMAVRDRLTARVVAITGSAGKTSTKDLTAAALSPALRVAASPGNFNNEIGVPLSIMAADDATDVAVIEVGARGSGHIRSLMPLVRPSVGVVTNVGSAHAEMFGSMDDTAREKGSLIEALPADGTAVLNADDDRVRAMAERTEAAVVLFGRGPQADVRALDIVVGADGKPAFTVSTPSGQAEVSLSMIGEHMVDNALAALAVAHVLGVDAQEAARGVSACRPSRWRMDARVADGRTIINDAYNASPESMAAGLKTLSAMGRGRPTWAVLGHMAELGDQSLEAHDRTGRLAVRLGVGNLLVVGEDARAIYEAARGEGMFGGEARFAADVDAAIALLQQQLEPDAVVLVKASRAAGLERIAEALA